MDWASLAKQWIAQREVMGMTSIAANADAQYVSQPIPAAPPPPPPPPETTDDVIPPVDLPAGGQEVAVTDSSTAQVQGWSHVLLGDFTF